MIIVVPRVIAAGLCVYGQVNKPGYLAFTPGKTMEWYIEQAGRLRPPEPAITGPNIINEVRQKSGVWVVKMLFVQVR